MFACLPYVRITSLFRNDEQAGGDGERANGYGNACRGCRCLQSRTISLPTASERCSANPALCSPTRSAARAPTKAPQGRVCSTDPVQLQLIPVAQQSSMNGALKRWAWGQREKQWSVGSDQQPCSGAPGAGKSHGSAHRGLWEGQICKAALWTPWGTNVWAMPKHSTLQSKRNTLTVNCSSDNFANWHLAAADSWDNKVKIF